MIAAAAIDHLDNRKTVVFAALSQEVWAVENLTEEARKAIAVGKLSEHPDAAEATVVYGAARDGRRWRNRRWVTGPKAGLSEDVDIITGPVVSHEFFGMRAAALIRRLAGQRQ